MYEKYFKRLLDIILSTLAIVMLSPVFLIIAILVRVRLGSPILFTQERPGRDEEIFKLYKFRTMNDNRDEEGVLLPDSERLPRFGQLLRSTSLDEFPELWNILKGDMSIVGPRPLLIRYLPYYTKKERVRHSVRPGLTGLAQVNGRNILEWDKRLLLDIEYVSKINFILDSKILFKTIKKVVEKDDIIVVDQGPLNDLDVERRSNHDD